MKLIDIAQREITLVLTPEDALAIAQAFHYAAAYTPHHTPADVVLCGTLTAFFDAAAIAAAAHSYAELPADWGLDKVRAALAPLTWDRGEGCSPSLSTPAGSC